MPPGCFDGGSIWGTATRPPSRGRKALRCHLMNGGYASRRSLGDSCPDRPLNSCPDRPLRGVASRRWNAVSQAVVDSLEVVGLGPGDGCPLLQLAYVELLLRVCTPVRQEPDALLSETAAALLWSLPVVGPPL